MDPVKSRQEEYQRTLDRLVERELRCREYRSIILKGLLGGAVPTAVLAALITFLVATFRLWKDALL